MRFVLSPSSNRLCILSLMLLERLAARRPLRHGLPQDSEGSQRPICECSVARWRWTSQSDVPSTCHPDVTSKKNKEKQRQDIQGCFICFAMGWCMLSLGNPEMILRIWGSKPISSIRSWQAWQNVWIFTAFSCCTRSGTLCLLYHLHLLLLLKQNLLKCPNVVAMLCIKQTPTTHVFSVWGKICRNQGFLHVFYPQIWVSDPNIAKHWPRVSFVQNEVACRFHVDCDWQTYICTSKWFLEQHIHSI